MEIVPCWSSYQWHWLWNDFHIQSCLVYLFKKVLILGLVKLSDLSFADSFFAFSMVRSWWVNSSWCMFLDCIADDRLISRGTFQIVGPWSYKTLIVVQYLLPAILLAGVFWFPESAYYLIKNGKFEEARQALNRTHGSGDQDFINVEMKRITENVRFSEQLKKEAALGGPLIYQCFRGKNAVSPLVYGLTIATYMDRDPPRHRSTTHRRVLLRWMYHPLSSI
jgi:Sugar (and other) transporter